MNKQEKITIGPQEGPQYEFLSSLADIAVFGGAAGSGKSYALLLEPLRHFSNPRFGGVIFRRNTTQVRNEGGLWDESCQLYPLLGAKPREVNLEWSFPSGMRMKFTHLEHEKTVLEWQGAQIPYIGFDELTHFTEQQFWYMLSRNRSTSGVKGYIRCTTNPDADSWVRNLLDWWIDPSTGYPIKERSGVLRWFIRVDDRLIWGETKEALIETYGASQQPKSLTFISALLQDNKILMEKDPSYLSNLMSLPRVERERLLAGNWNIKPSAGNYFQRGYFKVLDACSNQILRTIRYWDRAATKPSETNKDPDWTVGCKLGLLNTGVWVILDMVAIQDSPLAVERLVINTASQDGYECPIGLEQDPGSAGVADVQNMVRKLAGYNVKINKPTKDKITRAGPVSAQCEAGNVFVLKGTWNEQFFREAENFPEGNHDDRVDALSGAFNELAQGRSILDVL